MNKNERRVWYHQIYLQSEHWRKTRAEAIVRAGGACEICGCRGRLEVHHESYKRLWKEIPDDLFVLCDVCHRMYHDTVSDRERRTFRQEERERRIADMKNSSAYILAEVRGGDDEIADDLCGMFRLGGDA